MPLGACAQHDQLYWSQHLIRYSQDLQCFFENCSASMLSSQYWTLSNKPFTVYMHIEVAFHSSELIGKALPLPKVNCFETTPLDGANTLRNFALDMCISYDKVAARFLTMLSSERNLLQLYRVEYYKAPFKPLINIEFL